jgi:hypothetical protein
MTEAERAEAAAELETIILQWLDETAPPADEP